MPVGLVSKSGKSPIKFKGSILTLIMSHTEGEGDILFLVRIPLASA